MCEPPSLAEQSVRSLPPEEKQPADNCDSDTNSNVAAASASGAQIPSLEPGTATNELREPVADAAPEHETPEIAPPTSAIADCCSSPIQNDASPTHPGRDACAAEPQNEIERRQRDSGLASIDIELSQQSEISATQPVPNECQRQKPDPNAAESQEEATEFAGPDNMPATVAGSASSPAVKSVPSPVAIAADARSITARSIGGRSLFAPSTISPEDEVLSLRVRSLYDSGVGGMGSDVSSQFSSDIARRRISSIIEESAHLGVSQVRGTRSSFPGASRDVARRSRMGGSVEGGISEVDC
ncbi:hypothetical protein FN846DRAFT_145086 [Sphaerosporella brunnea]|uniref:Uncharacterized protein n=1 Tax=Sphaerosporella brunnea TaxID=1250544 RepID=A0A5J5ES96_9PEZI|nr:hypothetical protein FN846DRAFT_145086 [Sphaerosporella brunnea]